MLNILGVGEMSDGEELPALHQSQGLNIVSPHCVRPLLSWDMMFSVTSRLYLLLHKEKQFILVLAHRCLPFSRGFPIKSQTRWSVKVT